MAEILDACCGGRMWWWDKAHPLAVYVDKRERPAGTILQKPLWKIAPDVVADFRALPLEDESFRLGQSNCVVRERQMCGAPEGAPHHQTEGVP